MKKHAWAISSILLIAGLAAQGWAAEPASAIPPSGTPVQVTQLKAAVEAGAVSLTLKATGPFDYTSYRPSENLYVVDLPGVRSSQPGSARVLSSKLVTSYRLLQFAANNRPVLRLEFLLREPITPTVTHEPADTLIIRFGEASTHAEQAMLELPRAEPSAPSTARMATAIRNVSLETSSGPVVLVEADGRLHYEISRAENPPRLVLDFPGTTARVVRRRVNGQMPPVKAVRVGQFQPTVTRVVVDLEEFAEYKIDLTDDTLRLLFVTPGQTQAIARAQQPEPQSGEAVQPPAEPTKTAHADAPTSLPAPPETSEQPAVTPAVPENSGVAAQPAVVETSLAATEKAEIARPESTTDSLAVAPQVVAPSPASAVAKEEPAEEAMPRTEVQKRAESKPEMVTMSQDSSPLLAVPATLASLASPSPSSSPAVSLSAATPVTAAARVQEQPAPAQQQPAPEAAAQQAPKPKYTGEPISVNLKDVELKDFFRLIHEISGLNIVVDPAVKGTLTIVLDDVPWDQAIDIVLRNNELGKELEGNVLRLATLTTLKREEDMRRDLALARAQAVDPVTTTRVLSYAKAGTLKDTLKRFLSPRGELIADDRSNTLIIRDIPMVIPVMDNLIRQLDRKSLQVEIEARVVTASRQFAREIGTQFGFATSANARTVFGGLVGPGGFTSPVIRGLGLPIPPLVVAGGTAGNQIPLNVNLPTSAPTSGVTFAHSSPNLALDFIISAAESKGIGKLLSKPKVVTQNNVKASVSQGVKIPIQTTINNTISVQFIDVTLRLTVTPQITAENTVFMDIDVENTAIDPGIPRINGIPALDTQAATTQVLVNDGGTVVIGGVIISNQQINIAQVPLIGSIPVIGHLFKRQKVETNSQELLFFITPKIVPS